MREYQKLPFRTGHASSGFSKIFGLISFFISAGFSFWVTARLMNWFVPDETIASLWRRLAEMILFVPVCVILTLLIWVFFLFLMIVLVKILNIQPNPEYDSKEKECDKPGSPSVWPYWLMVIFFGFVYCFGLFSIVREMMTLPFSPVYFIIILLMTALLGAPVGIGIFRIRQAGRGEKLPTFTPVYTQQKVSPAFQKAVVGVIFVFLMGLGVLFVEQTLQFQKIARSAQGVVKRWVEHGYGRGRYTELEVQYTTAEGITRTLESTHHSSISFLMPNVGQTVKILYNPNDPADFRIDQFSEMWSQTIVCVFFSLIVLIFGTISVLMRQKKHK